MSAMSDPMPPALRDPTATAALRHLREEPRPHGHATIGDWLAVKWDCTRLRLWERWTRYLPVE